MMDSNDLTLYQFPLSLYCEKTRWNLDAKALHYRCKDLMPGLHVLPAWHLARQRSLPILSDGTQSVGDSTRIALYLEDRYPQPQLIPTDAQHRQQVLAFEEYFDELGEHVRRFCWSMAIGHSQVSNIFFGFSGYSPAQQLWAASSKPLLRYMIRRTFQVYPLQVAASWARIMEAIPQLEEWLNHDVRNFLVGQQFSLADLTAASMLAPLVGPDHSPWADTRLPALNMHQRNELRHTLVGQWVLRLYREYRNKVPSNQHIFSNG